MPTKFNIEDFKLPEGHDPHGKAIHQTMARLSYFAHKDQKYGLILPYTYHLADVEAKILLVNSKRDILVMMDLMGYKEEYSFEGMKNILKALALGHDLIEDTFVTEDTLAQLGFPNFFISAIVAMTKRDGETLEEYINRLIMNPMAIMCKKADSFSNLQHSLHDGDEGAIKRVKKYTQVLRYLSGVDKVSFPEGFTFGDAYAG